jgi:hypothetical protein
VIDYIEKNKEYNDKYGKILNELIYIKKKYKVYYDTYKEINIEVIDEDMKKQREERKKSSN